MDLWLRIFWSFWMTMSHVEQWMVQWSSDDLLNIDLNLHKNFISFCFIINRDHRCIQFCASELLLSQWYLWSIRNAKPFTVNKNILEKLLPLDLLYAFSYAFNIYWKMPSSTVIFFFFWQMKWISNWNAHKFAWILCCSHNSFAIQMHLFSWYDSTS